MTRSCRCGLCDSTKHRVDGCPRVSVMFLFDRIAWINKRMPREHTLAFQRLDTQWRRDHGYCTDCPRKVKPGRWRCDRCERRRKTFKSRSARVRQREYAQRIQRNPFYWRRRKRKRKASR